MGLKSYYYKELAYFGPLLYTDSTVDKFENSQINLIDGEELTKLIIELKIGINEIMVHEIDENFYDKFMNM